MFERFTEDARRVVLQALNVEAVALGARTVEDEHLLLALSETIGVGHDTLTKALQAETAASLSAVSVSMRPPPRKAHIPPADHGHLGEDRITPGARHGASRPAGDRSGAVAAVVASKH